MSRVRLLPLRREPPRTRTRADIPSVVDLVLDPELAPLALLEAAAHVLIQALVAENPQMLQCADHPTAVRDPVTVAAYRVVAACRGLHDALDLYRARVRECRLRDEARDDDIPF
jgi:hypothetical protein